MSVFGGLFSHDRKSARATGDYIDPASQSAPQPPSDDSSTPQGAPQVTSQASRLPTPPPPKRKRPGAFDDDHYQQTMLALAAGFFGSNGLGEGLANAARVIGGVNESARSANRPQLGGPDDAFEVYTDPVTGEHTFKPIQAVADYLQNKNLAAAALRRPQAAPKDHLDAVGRLANTVSLMDPSKQASGWSDGRSLLGHMGFDLDAIPEAFDPAFASLGQTVPQAAAAQDRKKGLQLREDRQNVMASQGAERLAEGHERNRLAGEASRRAGHNAARQDLKAGIIDGYQYRRDPVTGKVQKRKVYDVQ